MVVQGAAPRKADTDDKRIELDLDLHAVAGEEEEQGGNNTGLPDREIVAVAAGKRIDTHVHIPPPAGSAAEIAVEVDDTPHSQRTHDHGHDRRHTAPAAAQKDAGHTGPEPAEAQEPQQDSRRDHRWGSTPTAGRARRCR